MKTIISTLVFVSVQLLSYGQIITSYYKPIQGIAGLPCRADFSVTKISENEESVTFSVKLTKVIPDFSAGFWEGDRYYTCLQLGDVCDRYKIKMLAVYPFGKFDGGTTQPLTGSGGSLTFHSVGESVQFSQDKHKFEKVGNGSKSAGYYSSVIISELRDINVYVSDELYTAVKTKVDEIERAKLRSNTSIGSQNSNSSPNSTTSTQTDNNNLPPNSPLQGTNYQTYSTPPATDKVTQGILIATDVVTTTAAIVDIFTQAREVRDKKEELQKVAYNNALSEEEVKAEKYKKYAAITFNQALGSYNQLSDNTSIQSKVNLIFLQRLIEEKYSFYSDRVGKSFSCDISYLLPQREDWLNKAKNEGNFDAILFSHGILHNKSEDIAKLKSIAEKGSKDAMIQLARYYDKKKAISSFVVELIGNDANQALYWYTKAAESGCPAGKYYLGMIYKYGTTYHDALFKSYFVKYDIKKDLNKAYDYFFEASKLVGYNHSNYAELMLYGRYPVYDIVSSFRERTFYELSRFYEKGKVVPKSEEKASQIFYNGVSISVNSKNIIFPEHINDGFKYNTTNWKQENNNNILLEIKDQKYIMESKKGGSYYSVVPILQLSDNFLISFTTNKIHGPDEFFYGMIMGHNCVTGYHHFIANTGSQEFVFAEKGLTPHDLVKTKTDKLNGGNQKNQYFIQKKDNKISIWINNELIINEQEVNGLYGNGFGFMLYSGDNPLKIEIEDFMFHTIY